MSKNINLARLVNYLDIPDGNRYVVGSGDSRGGLRGRQIGVLALKHSPGYEIVLQLDNGSIDTFSPYQLFPERRAGGAA